MEKKITIIVMTVGLLIAGILQSCQRQEASLTNGVVQTGFQINGLVDRAYYGDRAYAVVRVEAIPGLYEHFRSVLSSEGFIRWDSKVDCNHFATLFVALSQLKFARAAFHSETKAQTLAMAEYWYLLPDGSAHALVKIDTDQGIKYLEPQTGKFVNVSGYKLLEKW